MCACLDFGAPHTVDVRDIDEATAIAMVGFTGAKVNGCVGPRQPTINIRPGQLLGAPASAVGELMPGEEVHCQRNGSVDVYVHDGVARLVPHSAETTAYLLNPDAPNLLGAFGIALNRALAQTGALVLHAAATSWSDHKLLIIGASGSGKSTLAVSTLANGGIILSDDLILACPPRDRHGLFRLHPMRRDLYLRPDTSRIVQSAVDDLLEPTLTASGPKLRIRRERWGNLFTQTAELTCILLLSRSAVRQSRSRLEKIGQAPALAAIIGANPFLAPGSGCREPIAMSTAIKLASAAPALRLDVGSDLLSKPKRELQHIRQLLSLALTPTSSAKCKEN